MTMPESDERLIINDRLASLKDKLDDCFKLFNDLPYEDKTDVKGWHIDSGVISWEEMDLDGRYYIKCLEVNVGANKWCYWYKDYALIVAREDFWWRPWLKYIFKAPLDEYNSD